jgi:mediator of replication checkpoint protein 1
MTMALTRLRDKTKRDDEKNINQLYKDLMNGGLRKRAGRDAFDMSDSEDEAELKQRRKREDFQRMQKALLSDENIGKIAENPKQQAFFKTLADFGDDVDYDFLDMPAELGIDALQSQSQSQSQSQEGVEGEEVIPDSQTLDSTAMAAPPNPLKRKSPSSQKENRPPPQFRRTAASDSMTRKPVTLEDVQHSVSELLEDTRIMVPDSQYSSDEDEDEDDDSQPLRTARKPIVDRLTLSRQSTLESCSGDSGLAFHASSRTSTGPGFRVPSLMRQATSNLSATTERSSGQSVPADGGVRRGGTGRSNIHAQAREAERRAVLEKSESKRKEALRRKVDVGRKRGMRSVLGDLGGGFE